MCPLCVVQQQCPGDRVEHVVGHATGVAPLDARVVLDADPGEGRDLGPAKAGDAATAQARRQPDLLR